MLCKVTAKSTIVIELKMAHDPANQEQFMKDVLASRQDNAMDYSDPSNLPDAETLLEMLQQMQGIDSKDLEQLKSEIMKASTGNNETPPPTVEPNYLVFYAMLFILLMLFGKRSLKAGKYKRGEVLIILILYL